MKCIRIALGVALVSIGLASCGSSGKGSDAASSDQHVGALAAQLPEHYAKAGKFHVGVSCTNPPAASIGLDGKNTGYEIDIIKQLAKLAFGSDKDVEFQCTDESNRVSFVQSGKVDFHLGSMAWTPERAKAVDFTEPFWVSSLQLIVPKNSDIGGYGDLKGKTVIEVTGSTYTAWMEACHPEAKLKLTQSVSDATAALTQGRGDAFGFIDVFNWNFVNKNPKYKLAGSLASPAVQAAFVKKGNDDLTTWLNLALEKLRKDDFFYKAFSSTVKDASFVKQFRSIVPGPDKKLELKESAQNCNP